MEQHNITWRGISIEITFTSQKFGMVEHVELRTDGKVALPVTETGYRSNFLQIGTVAAHGGVETFVTAWLENEAMAKGWSGAQLSLF